MPEPDLRFPIGEFRFPQTVSPSELATFIDQIAETPANVRAALAGLDDAQLDTPYRPGGWTVRQLAHHIPDSHINSYVRYRLALTEDTPVIKPYEEQLWAELADARTMPIAPSLDLLESLHARWVPLLGSLSPSDWARSFRHPALGLVRLDQNAALYAWHGRHHVAHITSLRKRIRW
jgi:hypothetical protein